MSNIAANQIKLDLAAIPPSIEERNGTYYITQSPITFAAVIMRFQEGLSPETIHRDCFPSLPLAHIYSAVSFYLSNQEQVETYLAQIKQEEDERQRQLLTTYPEFIKTAEELRERVTSAPQK